MILCIQLSVPSETPALIQRVQSDLSACQHVLSTKTQIKLSHRQPNTTKLPCRAYICVTLPDLLLGLHEVLKDVIHDNNICILQQNILRADVSLEDL